VKHAECTRTEPPAQNLRTMRFILEIEVFLLPLQWCSEKDVAIKTVKIRHKIYVKHSTITDAFLGVVTLYYISFKSTALCLFI
jgi:hypothetical protein